MTVKYKSLVSKDSFPVSFSHDVPHKDYEYTVYHFKSTLPAGEYTLELDFESELSRSMAGYYLSTYIADSETKHLATTQFEPTSARLAFPCLDEPNKKAIFDITMICDEKYSALSNMPTKSVTTVGTQKVFDFIPTVKMSTYLVAFIVSDFEPISSQTKNGVKVSVYTQPGSSYLGEYALKVAVPILEYYQDAFGIDFPLPKLDMIAIPDFAAGAMENWGLVTYRDTALLYDPKRSTPNNKQRVATVVGHELAHQWFGNLVTMKWWNDLWLNEGFAEFMEYKSVAAAEPTWNMTDQFIPLDLVRALQADESYFTHAIALPVKNPNEISSIFDDISYGKGSSILRMLEAWMDEKYGKGVFFQKLHNYLSSHAYQNAETQELWAALRTDDQDVGAFMDTWTNQPGFPFLHFADLERSSVMVHQERFLFGHLLKERLIDQRRLPLTVQSPEPAAQFWSVPLSYAIYSNATGSPKRLARGFTEVSRLGEIKVEFAEVYPADCILLANFEQTSVYRSLYDVRTYHYVIEWLQNDLEFLPPVERAGLLSDVFAMTLSGRLEDPTIALELTKILAKETNILVWETALKDLENLKDIFALFPTYGPIIRYQNSLIEKVIAHVGWVETTADDSAHHLRAMLRARLLAEAVRNNHKSTVAKALEYFKLIKSGQTDKVDVAPDVFGAIYDAGVIYGDLDDYDFVLSKFKASTFAPDQQIYLHALASSPVPYLQARTCSIAISGAVRKQDIKVLLSQVATLSPVGHISVWLFLMDNWEAIVSIFTGSDFGKINDLLEDVTSAFTKPYLISEAERLFVDQSDPEFEVPAGAQVSVLKGLETAKQLLEWRKLYGSRVADWLATQ
ncbi:peptidase family M1-domain-containing protein [Globomyces pollinis-pini]|nr:peptidase family M1-domain-containing protein [Globomyces pollinis-pini]